MSLAQLFLDAVVSSEGDIGFDPAKLATATREFEGALQSTDPAGATEELLSVAFFLEVKKGARAAALELVAIARRAVVVLKRAGIAFDELAASTERRAAALLGNGQSKVPVGQRAGAGARWWQLR